MPLGYLYISVYSCAAQRSVKRKKERKKEKERGETGMPTPHKGWDLRPRISYVPASISL
jgi:hypothetical protein